MATKKPAPKKTTTRKTSATKKATTAKSRPAAKRTVNPKKPTVRSFRRSAEVEPFMTVKLTRQTVYWLIISVVAVAFAVWVLKLQSDINELYSQIESIRASELDLPITVEKSTE